MRNYIHCHGFTQLFKYYCNKDKIYYNQFNGLDRSLLVKHLELKIYTTLGYIVSLILLNLGHVFRFRIVSWRCEIQKDKWNNITKSCVYLQYITTCSRTYPDVNINFNNESALLFSWNRKIGEQFYSWKWENTSCYWNVQSQNVMSRL